MENTENSQSNRFKYAQVIVDIPELDARTFSYLIPDELQEKIKIGLPILVPFGNQGAINAYIVGFGNYLPEGIKAKSIYEILDVEPVFDLEYLKFLEWISNYYCCNLPTVITTALPLNFISKAKKIAVLTDKDFDKSSLKIEQLKIIELLQDKKSFSLSFLQKKSKIPSSKFYETLRKLRLSEIIEIKNIIEENNQKAKLEKWIKLVNKDIENKRYAAILNTLEEAGGSCKFGEFQDLAKTTSNTLKKIQETGNVEIFELEVYRNALKIFENVAKEDFFELNFDQKLAYEKIEKAIDTNDSEPLLLYGITGSGKTEVYLHAFKHVLEQGKNVIFLAPEIALASQLARRISQRFGIEKVAIWHSNLADGERFDVWNKIRNNEIRIIVGARSAIFAPIKNIGLIIIDEEHESSYKQTSPTPRYNAKDLAFERAKRAGATIVLGSATPDIATYYRAINTNRVLTLPERVGNATLPRVVTVDMTQEKDFGNRGIFSRALKKALKVNIETKRQSILLINRRGFSTYNFCNSCGYTAECQKCSIPLILHKTNDSLRCHYCNWETPTFTLCPKCGSEQIKNFGLGTQKVEMEFIKEFPNATVARIDSDIMSKKNVHIEVLDEFSKGNIDVLIGTQMVAKGLDIPNVTLVGVLMSDSLFNMPDFRASERGFQLLTQVAGRAGRGEERGRVYFQTYTPDFFALELAQKQDFISFYYSEINTRYENSYPPYSQIIRLILSCKNPIRVEKYAEELAYKLKMLVDSKGIEERLEILGPSQCLIAKLKDEFRFQILIKNRLGENGHFQITSFVKKFPIPEDIKFLIDVDPADML